jgi:excisionase family DNA binding protein
MESVALFVRSIHESQLGLLTTALYLLLFSLSAIITAMTTSHLPPDFQMHAFYTPDEVAALLRVHVSTVRDWIRSERLFAYRISERVSRVPLGALMELLGEPQPVAHRILSPADGQVVWAAIASEHPELDPG